jgi:hypothetical protein
LANIFLLRSGDAAATTLPTSPTKNACSSSQSLTAAVLPQFLGDAQIVDVCRSSQELTDSPQFTNEWKYFTHFLGSNPRVLNVSDRLLPFLHQFEKAGLLLSRLPRDMEQYESVIREIAPRVTIIVLLLLNYFLNFL